MKRFFSTVLTVFILIPMLISVLPSSAAASIEVGFSSPAICTDVGKAVELSEVAVQFTYCGEVTPASEISWSCGGTAVTSYTPSEKGVYPLTASANGLTKTVYIVAKREDEKEHILYSDDFSSAPELSQFRLIQQPAGSSFGYDEAEGAIFLDASDNGSSHMRLLLPSFLDDFGDAIFSARVKITDQTAASRFGAMIFRLQDPTGKKIPYMQTAFRYDISASNGLEIAERTSADKWNVTQKCSVSGIRGGEYLDVCASFCGSVSTSTVNGKTYLTEKATPYSEGAMGFQVRGARLTVDSVTVAVNPDSRVSTPPKTIADIRDPSSNIALTPALITEVSTSAELSALETSLPSVAILEAAMSEGKLGVMLDGDFKAIADAAVCERVIPAYRIDSAEEAHALGERAAAEELCDMYAISEDDALISAARAVCNMLYGMLDLRGIAPEAMPSDEELRGRIIACGARGVILSEAQASRELTSYLQDRYLAVWQEVTSQDISAVTAINRGVLGVLTPEVSATEQCFTKYYAKNTLVRTPEIIGHRGVPSMAQENSLAGAEMAFKVGATMVECDIYLMRDGNIVIMHDSTLDRTTNGEGKMTDQTAETIKKYVIDSASAPTQPIPLLDDYFECFRDTGKVIVVELKSSDFKLIKPLAELIKKYDMERQVVIIAFSKDMIAAMRRECPDISVNFLTSSITANEQRSLEVAGEILQNVIPINTAYSPSQAAGTLGPKLYADLAARGVTLWNWTVNDQSKLDRYFTDGIRGITTNYSQWVRNYIKDFTWELSADGTIKLNALTYSGGSSNTDAAELIVIGGTGTYENGRVELSESAEGFFFSLKGTLSSGASYNVVTPVMLKSDYLNATAPAEDTTQAGDTGAQTDATSDTVKAEDSATASDKEKGCGGELSLTIFAVLAVAAVIVVRKEDE